MNFDAIEKLCAKCVTDLLKDKEEAMGTRQILILTRYIIDAFLDKSLTPQERIYYIWYSTFFLRLWRSWIKQHKTYNLTKNFFTLNTYTCVEINAHGLLILLDKCRETNSPQSFLPWLYSSQPCEKFFRKTRSLTSTFSTVVNFDMLDIIQRRHRIQTLNNIVSEAGKLILKNPKKSLTKCFILGTNFIFPRENKTKKLGINSVRNNALPSVNEVEAVLERAKSDALKDSKQLSLYLDLETETAALSTVSLPQNFQSIGESNDEGRTYLESHQDCVAEEPNIEDINDIQEDEQHFKNITSLNLRDFSGKIESSKGNDKSFLKICINNKEKVVRKSTLCWYLYEKECGRLSSDRLIRCKSLGSTNNSKSFARNNKLLRKNKIKEVTSSEDSEDQAESVDLLSEFENESFTDVEEISDETDKLESLVTIKPEEYYSVFYDETWYIGRVTEMLENKSNIKFLKAELDKYVWPIKTDIQTVSNKFIFYGPLSLVGNYPFTLKRHEKMAIEARYKELKKCL